MCSVIPCKFLTEYDHFLYIFSTLRVGCTRTVDMGFVWIGGSWVNNL